MLTDPRIEGLGKTLALYRAARYDECECGLVEHAIRLVVKRTRRHYIYPATLRFDDARC